MSWFDGDIHFPSFLLRWLFYVVSSPLFYRRSTTAAPFEKRKHVTHLVGTVFLLLLLLLYGKFAAHVWHRLNSHKRARCNTIVQKRKFLSFHFYRAPWNIHCITIFGVASFTHFLSFNKVFIYVYIFEANDRVSIFIPSFSFSFSFCLELRTFHDPDNRCHLSDTHTYTHIFCTF